MVSGYWLMLSQWGMENRGMSRGVICLYELCLQRLQSDSLSCVMLGKLLCLSETLFPPL